MLGKWCDPLYKEEQAVSSEQSIETPVQSQSEASSPINPPVEALPEGWSCPAAPGPVGEVQDALDPNSPIIWDKLWSKELDGSWREQMLQGVYARVGKLTPEDAHVIDIGGGIGLLAEKLCGGKRTIEVWDHSEVALEACRGKGLEAKLVDLEDITHYPCVATSGERVPVMLGTEILEHLTDVGLRGVLTTAAVVGKAIFSVPNWRLSPEEESQHKRMFSALSFKQELEKYFKDVRVECIGRGFLLGVCGFPKGFKMSVTFPARNEAANIERTLASFRGVADEMVIGIDPRSTDATEEIARRYAEKVFTLESPEGRDSEDRAPEGGVHFADIRNQGIEKCSSEWIFMTEAHERLGTGHDVLLRLNKIVPAGVKLGFVLRTGQGQRWAFPWIIRNVPEVRYKRKTHNIVDFPQGTPGVRFPQISTIHERSHENAMARKEQRKIQNRTTLFEDWLTTGNEQSLYYFASELRDLSAEKTIVRLEQLLAMPSKMGAMRYQARMVLAKEYRKLNKLEDARRVLMGCAGEDWSRGEHWMWLGDMAFDEEQFEEALQFYRYLGTMLNSPPWTVWWIDLYVYGHLAAQRLAMCYSALGRAEEALVWARQVADLLPEGTPPEAWTECENNVRCLEEALGETAHKEQEVNAST